MQYGQVMSHVRTFRTHAGACSAKVNRAMARTTRDRAALEYIMKGLAENLAVFCYFEIDLMRGERWKLME